MPRTKRALKYRKIELSLPDDLLNKVDETLTPNGASKLPFGARQALIHRLLVQWLADIEVRHDMRD